MRKQVTHAIFLAQNKLKKCATNDGIALPMSLQINDKNKSINNGFRTIHLTTFNFVCDLF